MKFIKLLSLTILTGLLLGLAWFPSCTFLIFIAFIPLLFLTEEIENSTLKRKKLSLFLLTYLAFLIWNCFDTWWIWYASEGGAIAALVANALLMSLTYLLYFTLRRRIQNPAYSIWILLPVWMSFEYLHLNWELTWSWLTLGNVFAFEHNWVQWYQFTGVSGGTVWVLVINILLYQILSCKKQESRIKRVVTALLIILPIILSQLIIKLSNYQIDKSTTQVLIVQPNIDPYNDKFNGDFQGQLQGVYNKIKNKITAKTNYVVLPETFLTETIWENDMERSFSITFLKDSLLSKFPDLNIIIGANTLYHFEKNEKGHPLGQSATARAIENTDIFYDAYNTAIQLNKGGLTIYHKSKLVPGVERMPYPTLFKPLEGLAINLGGTFGSLGTQDTRDVFFNADKSIGIAPVVCYESIFGEYVADYIKNGANLIFIITNDGWWRDTPGYKQHLAYARLRAIETRRQIARSANTGISCIIDELGEVHAPQPWWKEGYILANLAPSNQKTFYVRFGDLLSKLAIFITAFVFGYSIFLRVRKR
ncbi:MAG: apolipoprotein N-acyltransferase [Bacteroidia bacterium]